MDLAQLTLGCLVNEQIDEKEEIMNSSKCRPFMWPEEAW
jgi:hypothetical protein